jgi:hypothetical protein
MNVRHCEDSNYPNEKIEDGFYKTLCSRQRVSLYSREWNSQASTQTEYCNQVT